jgi:hypothetical protein
MIPNACELFTFHFKGIPLLIRSMVHLRPRIGLKANPDFKTRVKIAASFGKLKTLSLSKGILCALLLSAVEG